MSENDEFESRGSSVDVSTLPTYENRFEYTG